MSDNQDRDDKVGNLSGVGHQLEDLELPVPLSSPPFQAVPSAGGSGSGISNEIANAASPGANSGSWFSASFQVPSSLGFHFIPSGDSGLRWSPVGGETSTFAQFEEQGEGRCNHGLTDGPNTDGAETDCTFNWSIKIEIPPLLGFREEYERNNKTDGKKHLKCFPFCGPDHRTTHPCIYPINLTYSFERSNITATTNDSDSDPPNLGDVIAVARFVCTTEEENSVRKSMMGRNYVDMLTGFDRDMRVGETFPAWQIENHLKSKSNPKGLLFHGARIVRELHSRRETGTFQFKQRAWHYGWTAARFRQTMHHCLRFYIFERQSCHTQGRSNGMRQSSSSSTLVDSGSDLGSATDSLLICRAIVDSPGFTLISSRSRYNKRKRDANLEESEESDSSHPKPSRSPSLTSRS